MKKKLATFLVECVEAKIGFVGKIEREALIEDFMGNDFAFLEEQLFRLQAENLAKAKLRQDIFTVWNKKKGEKRPIKGDKTTK